MRNRLLGPTCLLGAWLATGCESPPAPTDSDVPPVALPAPSAQDEETSLAASNCNQLVTQAVTASGDDGNVPANTQDDNLGTRWSAQGTGVWLQMDLGSAQTLTGTTIAWHRGNERQNHFVVSTSTDGSTFTQAYAGDSALNTSAQTVAFSSRSARYVRITVNGNTVNDWNSIAETRACAASAPPSSSDSGPVLPRQPYLQSVKQTSAIVAFRTASSCNPTVRYGEGTSLTSSVSAGVSGTRHAVKLDGLSAGRTYGYVVEACGSKTGLRSFQTSTTSAATKAHFTAMGDFGTGGSMQKKVMAVMNTPQWRSELLLALGDNAYPDGTDAEFQAHLFTPMAGLLREVPMFATPGNHEYVTNQAQPYLDNMYLPANNPQGTERYYSFDWGPVHFISLDSNCAVGLASADRCTLAAQKAWAESDLAANTRPWTVAFFHHPSWSSGEHGSQLTMRRQFGPLFEKYGVDLVLTGHDHDYERSKPMFGDNVASSTQRGIPYLVVGSGGATLRPFPNSQPAWTALRDNQAYGFLDVTVDGGTLTARLITSSNTVRDTLMLKKTLAKASARGVQASALEAEEAAAEEAHDTPPGPTDDRAEPVQRGPVPPADTLESVADPEEPLPQ
ncbi:alkaline phosphatase [Corallococcus coralloides DSM 2259]|uniref:Alkaline phosphatase n=1 Tax=Corallococcus coralloides (strain ATCC 25202 / DSM 2259 / NBRC 100086 / M2) TaxID=1144275 RepID=H8ML22_CORCM|nr:discoidin domain-containing protein [Corallococcus coralloides]AFE09810.1 alkaline phosphatase [Corallococcus coralloides DSM 2259]